MEASVVGTAPRPIGGTLVIQPLPGIGDTIWHLPHLKSIAAQTREKKVTLLTKRRARADELLEHADFIETVLLLDETKHRGPFGGFALGNDLKPYRFDVTWILHPSPRYGLAAWRGGIAERIGYGIGWQDAFLTTAHALPREAKKLSAIEKANRLLANHSVPKIESVPHLPLPDVLIAEMRAELGDLPRPWSTLVIGASEPFKQWGEANFSELADQLHRKTGGTVFLLGGSAEADMAARIQSRLSNPGWLVPVIDRPLLQAAAVTALSDIAIGNDTGFINIAAATGTTSFCLFGGSVPLAEDPRMTAIMPHGEVRYGTDRMEEIAPDTVFSAAVSALSGE